jgi:hypothetical protein
MVTLIFTGEDNPQVVFYLVIRTFFTTGFIGLKKRGIMDRLCGRQLIEQSLPFS